MPLRCHRRADAGDGCAVSEQDFGRHNRPGKLKTWKPDTLLGVADSQIPRFSEFQILTPFRGTGEEGVPAAPRADPQADFFIASSMTSAAQLDALCKVAVLRCE